MADPPLVNSDLDEFIISLPQGRTRFLRTEYPFFSGFSGRPVQDGGDMAHSNELLQSCQGCDKKGKLACQ